MNIHSDYVIDIQNNYPSNSTLEVPGVSQLEAWSQAVFKHEKLAEAELTLRLVDEAEIQALNKRYRGKDKPTNVLSFPADIPAGVALDLPFLGDIILCVPVIYQEAHEQKKTVPAHWAHIVIHGILHLLHYDHINDHDAAIMEEKEILILKSLNINNPYSDDEE
ncbi:MAG: rRNA maturation RNase YbeY [Pseudomonadota bacterium]